MAAKEKKEKNDKPAASPAVMAAISDKHPVDEDQVAAFSHAGLDLDKLLELLDVLMKRGGGLYELVLAMLALIRKPKTVKPESE